MTKKTYQIDLRDYDIKDYLLNPVVVWNFDWVEPIGKAVIATDRRSVEIEFADASISEFAAKTAKIASECFPAYVEDGGTKELIGLSVGPKRK